jgi:hypothetical protein
MWEGLRDFRSTGRSQAWVWTPEWQAKEREADEHIAAGLGEVFESDEEFLAALRREMKSPDAGV